MSKQIPGWKKRSQEPTEVQSQGQMFSVSCGGRKWMRCPGLLDVPEQREQGHAEHGSAWGSVAPVPAGTGQVTTGRCHYKTWMLTHPCPSLLSGSGWQEWWHSCPLTVAKDGVSIHVGKDLMWAHGRTGTLSSLSALWLTSTSSAATTFCLGQFSAPQVLAECALLVI